MFCLQAAKQTHQQAIRWFPALRGSGWWMSQSADESHPPLTLLHLKRVNICILIQMWVSKHVHTHRVWLHFDSSCDCDGSLTRSLVDFIWSSLMIRCSWTRIWTLESSECTLQTFQYRHRYLLIYLYFIVWMLIQIKEINRVTIVWTLTCNSLILCLLCALWIIQMSKALLAPSS